MRFLLIVIVLVVALVAPASAAIGQEVQRIAAIVNDDVISGYDLERRVELVIRSTRMPDTAEVRRQLRAKVLENLIDEKLQLQAADRLNIQVTERDMEAAIASLERQNDVPRGRFDEFIRHLGIDRDSLMQQIRARIAWNKVLARKLSPIPEEEVDEAMREMAAEVGKPEYRISEIYIPINVADRESEARATAAELYRQINGGVPFPAAAREFSSGVTAARGGQVGWVKPDQLSPEIGQALAELQVGEVSPPIRTPIGYYLIKLHERRRFMATDPSEIRVDLRQVMFGVPEGATQSQIDAARRRASDFTDAAADCGELEQAATRSDGADYLDLGMIGLTQLATPVRSAVETVPVNSFSEPLVVPAGVVLFMVCDRQQPTNDGLDREAVIEELMQKRLSQIAQRYIRDLRRDALVEYR